MGSTMLDVGQQGQLSILRSWALSEGEWFSWTEHAIVYESSRLVGTYACILHKHASLAHCMTRATSKAPSL